MRITLNMRPTREILRSHGLERGGDVQRFIDSEVLRLCDKYTPKRTGDMIRSGTRGTVIGRGKIIYTAPYARRNYYENSGHGKQGTARGGLRGRLWFERMKQAHGKAVLRGAAFIAGCAFRE